MKRRISAAAAVITLCLLTAHSAAYGLFCSDRTAPAAMNGYSARLIEVAEQFETALNQPETPANPESQTAEAAGETLPAVPELYAERLDIFDEFSAEHSTMEYALAEKLIDYDLLLQRLKTGTEQYSRLKESAADLAKKYLIGECGKSECDQAEKQRDDKYFELQSLLFDISVLKSEIEEQTGETLTSDFDFSSAYLITDALKISTDELSEWGAPGTICVPEGAEYAPEQADISAQYNAAVQCYYALGDALRSYVSAAEEYEAAAADSRLGAVSAESLAQTLGDYEDARLSALEKKAEYAKSLLKLDQSSGGALTAGNGTGSGLAAALRSALPEGLRGNGLWLSRSNGSEVRLTVSAYPVSFDPEEDTVRFEVRYNGAKLAKSSGNTAFFESPEPVSGVDRAEVIFYVNGSVAGKYEIDIYSPFGGFLEG